MYRTLSLALLATLWCVPFTQAAEEWKPADARLLTKWAEDVSPDNVLAEYPRPQMVRDEWTNLNGLWDYAIRPREEDKPESWDGKILVPFAVESALSGVNKRVSPKEKLWYHRTFEASPDDGRMLLNFGAVDWDATVWINGERVGGHRGGYDPFSLDITDAINEGENEIIVAVADPTSEGYQARGKQKLEPGGIWYTPVTGIWQTVWLEKVPTTHIESLRIAPDFDESTFEILVNASEEADVRIEVLDGDESVASSEGTTRNPVRLKIDDAKSWSPDSPHLYDLKIEVRRDGETIDQVQSYAGMRKIEVKADQEGVNRLFLNGEVLFQYGPLDQGWWPDGLYTAPTDEALAYDVEVTKELGFNMTRKHVKVEPARWYYWCDKMGLLVWQDMPNGDDEPNWERNVDKRTKELIRTPESAIQYREELTQMVQDFGNHPSIVVWVPFNERWGQSDTAETVALLRLLDSRRPINSASGGNFYGVGDILDVHSYPDPEMPRLDPYQAVVCGEFGGLGLPVEGHTLLEKDNWGYRSYKNAEDLQKAYLEKLEMLKPMIKKGLAAAIYTQITDVETETNGLLTYDREVIKMDTDEIAEANRSLYEDGETTE